MSHFSLRRRWKCAKTSLKQVELNNNNNNDNNNNNSNDNNSKKKKKKKQNQTKQQKMEPEIAEREQRETQMLPTGLFLPPTPLQFGAFPINWAFASEPPIFHFDMVPWGNEPELGGLVKLVASVASVASVAPVQNGSDQ